MTDFPDYAPLAEQIKSAGHPYTPAELYGVLCGCLAVKPVPSEAATLSCLAAHIGTARWPVAWVAGWQAMRKRVIDAYESDSMELPLLLPDDSLAERVTALASWCDGFMAGFAESCGSGKLPRSVNSALSDLMAISQAEAPASASEEEQRQFAEIEEHCRMVAVSVFTDMALSKKA